MRGDQHVPDQTWAFLNESFWLGMTRPWRIKREIKDLSIWKITEERERSRMYAVTYSSWGTEICLAVVFFLNVNKNNSLVLTLVGAQSYFIHIYYTKFSVKQYFMLIARLFIVIITYLSRVFLQSLLVLIMLES